MRRDARTRLLITLLFGLAVGLLLLARGAQLALLRHHEYAQEVEDQQTQIRQIPALRGVILDRAGRTLACTLENPSLALRLGAQTNRARLADALERAGLCSSQAARELAAADQEGFHWITRGWVDESRLRAVEGRFPELQKKPELKRFYPTGCLAPDVMGVVGVDGHGLTGVEWRHDSLLVGKPGQLLEFVTGGGLVENAPPPRVLVEPEAGGGLQLTLDARIQQVARHRLMEGMVRAGADSGYVIIMDPATGEILALHEEPTFDPLRSLNVAPQLLKTACFTDQFEPGSTFKVVPFAAALEGGAITPADTFDCLQGVRVVGRDRIRDHRKFGVLTAAEILTFSSNIGAGRIAERVGWDACYRMAQALGFGQTTGMDLGSEAVGYLPHPLCDGWSDRTMVTAAYGQEVACTALQMVLAYSAIANDGLLMKPMLIKARLDAAGRPVQRYTSTQVRRALSTETAYTLRTLLRRVVTDGTGSGAEIAWFAPAGKTGTAQIFDPEQGRYVTDEHLLSFIGFAPYDAPRVTCLVAVRCPGEAHASEVAVPIFAEILKDLVWILEEDRWAAAPTAADVTGRIQVPDVRGLTTQAARSALHRVGLVPVLSGWGAQVREVFPQPYRSVPESSVVHLSLGGTISHATVQVPEVRGLSLRRAAMLLGEAGLRVGVRGRGWVVRQEPEPGTTVEKNTLCVAWASPQDSRAREQALDTDALACQAR